MKKKTAKKVAMKIPSPQKKQPKKYEKQP